MTISRVIQILLVEDSPSDVRLTKEAFSDCHFPIHLSVVHDGVDAIRFLRREGPFAEAPHADIILLDLNLPRKSGREVLADIKEDPDLKRIPVVVLTTSENEKDIWATYDLHANAYITKPVDLSEFVTVIRTFEDFWLAQVKLPPQTNTEP